MHTPFGVSEVAEQQSPAAKIQSGLHVIANRDVNSDIVRRDVLGSDLDFSDCEKPYLQLQNFSKSMASLHWDSLPEGLQAEVLAALDEFNRELSRLQGFSIRTGRNPTVERNNVANRFKASTDRLLKAILPLASYLLWSSSTAADYQRAFDRVLSDTQQAAQQVADQSERVQTQADEALAAIREAAREQGVTQESSAFKEAADRYAEAAAKWLKASVLLGVLTVAVAVVVVWVWTPEGEHQRCRCPADYLG